MELKGCGQPWFELQIEYNEKVGCCCYYKFEKENLNMPLDIDRYWNGRFMQQLRQTIASNEVEGTGCEGCQVLQYNTGADFTKIPDGLTEPQIENWNKAIRDFKDKKINVDSYPVKYYMNFGLACNLKCVMCSQENLRHADRRQLPVEPLLEMKEHLIKANEIAIIGGEPLMLPNSRKFIETVINDPDYSHVKLSIYTNGTLLHKYIEPLQNMRRLNICISLDSVGAAYEYIRKGARWRDTEKNILTFKEVGAKNGLDWSVNIAAVVMKSSIPGIVEFVDWCIEHENPVHFVPIQAQGFTQDEEVFNYPELLSDIPGWEDNFNRAIEKLTDIGWIHGAADPLKIMRDEIEARVLLSEGEELFNAGDSSGALNKFCEASEKDPQYVVAYNNIGVTYWQTGDIEKSLDYFLKAMKVNPNDRDTVLNCGKVLLCLEQRDEARQLYSTYLRTHPNDMEISGILSEITG
jgi:sulfatase maturation enzyme AslB (radical SAM superfamily)